MIITFTHKKKKGEIPVSGPSEVKYYAVPTSYSDDGYFAAVWSGQDLEPVPACPAVDTVLLAHIKVNQQEDGSLVLQPVFCAEDVKYA